MMYAFADKKRTMQDKINIAVFVDYDNIEIGVKSTLRREFDVAICLDALKERGDIVAKFAYANWGRQEDATRQMAQNAVQMVQRLPSPRGDKNGADINLALDSLEMAFTHTHVNAFAIISGDSDFIPLVNKLKEYGKTVYVVGGKAFTSTILQQNCHEFISYESLLDDPKNAGREVREVREFRDRGDRRDRRDETPKDGQAPQGPQTQQPKKEFRPRPAPLELPLAMPLVERALQVLERREVQPQLGLLKSTMLQLDSSFSEKAYGCSSFSDFVDKLKKADLVNVGGSEGRYTIQRKGHGPKDRFAPRPEEALQPLREVLEIHRQEMEEGEPSENLNKWMLEEFQSFDHKKYGFQEFTEFLNFAQDKTVVRLEPHPERGLIVTLGAEFYPQAPPPAPPEIAEEEEEEEKQPIVIGQPSRFAPTPEPEPPQKAKRPVRRKMAGPSKQTGPRPTRRPRKKD